MDHLGCGGDWRCDWAAFIKAGEEVIFVDNVAANVEAINRDGSESLAVGDQRVRARHSCLKRWRSI